MPMAVLWWGERSMGDIGTGWGVEGNVGRGGAGAMDGSVNGVGLESPTHRKRRRSGSRDEGGGTPPLQYGSDAGAFFGGAGWEWELMMGW